MITIPNNILDTNYDDFIELNRKQDFSVDKMYDCIDHNNINGFIWYFEKWHDITSDLLNNPFNDCGHILCNEIIEYAKAHCFNTFAVFYPDEV